MPETNSEADVLREIMSPDQELIDEALVQQEKEIDKLKAEVAKLHRYLDMMEVSEYYDTFECTHEWKLTPHYRGIEHGEHALCNLCGASTETDDPIVKNLQRERMGE